MKRLLLITALALFVLPSGVNANLILKPDFADFTSRWALSQAGLQDDHCQRIENILCPAKNPDNRLIFQSKWVSSPIVSNLQFAFANAADSLQGSGWSPATSAMLSSNQIHSTSSQDMHLGQGEKKPDQIPASILFFAPGLAGILVGRNWPQKFSLRTIRRVIFKRTHHASKIPAHGNFLKIFLSVTGFVTYFQFIHFKLRTIQLNR